MNGMTHRLFILLLTQSLVGTLSANDRHNSSTVAPFDFTTTVHPPSVTNGMNEEQRTSLPPKAIFEQIERGILSNDGSSFTRYLRKQVFLSLPRTEGAYYSANQAASLIQNYCSTRRVLSFTLSTIDLKESGPYATGGGSVRFKGSVERFQVYVLLIKVGDEWVISQFSVF